MPARAMSICERRPEDRKALFVQAAALWLMPGPSGKNTDLGRPAQAGEYFRQQKQVFKKYRQETESHNSKAALQAQGISHGHAALFLMEA